MLEHQGNYEFVNIQEPCDEESKSIAQLQNDYGSVENNPTNVSKKNNIYICTRLRLCNILMQVDSEVQDDEDSNSSKLYKHRQSLTPPANASLMLYLKSIVFMPYSLRILCLTNLFCWMAHVCYSLYFTDFVGEAVFNGNPEVFALH